MYFFKSLGLRLEFYSNPADSLDTENLVGTYKGSKQDQSRV